jgi:16S rRNA processing protein RimM
MDFVVVGKVADTFGVGGELKIIPYAPEEVFDELRKVFFRERGGEFKEFLVEKVSRRGKFYLLKLNGIEDRDEASLFKGARLFLPKEVLPDREEDEYYAFELEGMEVFTDRGRKLGSVERIEDTGPYSSLILNGGKVWIPFVSQIVLSVDRTKRRITVREEKIP